MRGILGGQVEVQVGAADRRLIREADKTPLFGEVHVDEPLGRPHPVVLGLARDLQITFAVLRRLNLPLDAREVHLPYIAVPGRHRCPRRPPEPLPWEGDLHRPALVDVAGRVDRAVDPRPRLQPGDVPRVQSRSTVAIGPHQQQIPLGGKGVDLVLVVIVGVPVGIDEDLEVVVMEDDGVPVPQGRPDVGLFEKGGDVEILVVPKHLCTRSQPWPRLCLALDIDEGVGPGRLLPGRFVEGAVDGHGAGRA